MSEKEQPTFWPKPKTQREQLDAQLRKIVREEAARASEQFAQAIARLHAAHKTKDRDHEL